MSFPLFSVLLLVALAPLAEAQNKLPVMTAPTLAGKQVTLPDDAAGRVALLILGFTHGSKSADTAWARRVATDFAADLNFTFYQIAAVQDIPRLFRGVAEHGMRSDVPRKQQGHFLLLQSDEKQWKKFVDYKQPDHAYLLLLDRGGEVRSQWHGPFDSSQYRKLAAEIKTLEK